MNILITSGGTREAVDDVRYVSNISSGRTGSFLADTLIKRGLRTTLVMSKYAEPPSSAEISVHTFVSFGDLNKILEKQLGCEHYDAVIHLAAVSDYSISSVQVGEKVYSIGELSKIPSNQEIKLKLVPNFKILSRLKNYSLNKDILVFGFKLTSRLTKDQQLLAARTLLKDSNVDYVVSNDLKEISSHEHRAYLVHKSGTEIQTQTKEQLAQLIFQTLNNSYSNGAII